jgi:hypothetical protein
MVQPSQAEWMQDFIQSHRKEGTPPPRITTSASAPAAKPAAKKKNEPNPDWLKDFE